MNAPTKLMNEWITMGQIRALLHAVRAIDRELAALARVDFRKGWLRGKEARRFRRFLPDRVLENLAFILPPDHELWGWPVVRALQVLSLLNCQEAPDRTALLTTLKLVREGADELRAELRRLMHGLDVTMAYKDQWLGAPGRVSHPPPRVARPVHWLAGSTERPLFPQPPTAMKN